MREKKEKNRHRERLQGDRIKEEQHGREKQKQRNGKRIRLREAERNLGPECGREQAWPEKRPQASVLWL